MVRINASRFANRDAFLKVCSKKAQNHDASFVRVFFAHILRICYTCIILTYDILRILHSMLRIILVYNIRILRVYYTYSPHTSRIILADDMRILRVLNSTYKLCFTSLCSLWFSGLP